MASAVVSVEQNSGTIQLIVPEVFTRGLQSMFVAREELSKLTLGERELGCVSCMLHQTDNPQARPALVEGSVVTSDVRAELDTPMSDEAEVFLVCPMLAVAKAAGTGNFPCQTIGLMSIANS